ncbi:MAG: hypothetical protein K2H85_06495, partial [Allobaculum sp.]|nr:hypothetical protein [Allobaculum sp.]
GIIFFVSGNYLKNKAKKKAKTYKENGWGKVIMWLFIIMLGIATLWRVIMSVSENSFNEQVKKANQSCPISIAGGTGEITSIAIKDSMVIYNIDYDANVINLDRLEENSDNYKRIIILSSYLLNGQNNNGDRFLKIILDNHYGIAFKVQSNNGKEFTISANISELKALLHEAEKYPTEAMKEVLEWQLRDNQFTLPTRLDDDMTLVAIHCDSINLIYRVVIEEPLTISDIKENNTPMNRRAILRELYCEPSSKATLDICSIGNFNLVYRYVDEMNTDSCDIIFSHREISDIVRIPKSLNIR